MKQNITKVTLPHFTRYELVPWRICFLKQRDCKSQHSHRETFRFSQGKIIRTLENDIVAPSKSNTFSDWRKTSHSLPQGNNNINILLACDQVVLIETAENFRASRGKTNHSFSVCFPLLSWEASQNTYM